MSERREIPILFSGPMVRAILEGEKTVTRRPIVPQPSGVGHVLGTLVRGGPAKARGRMSLIHDVGSPDFPMNDAIPCPFGSPGDQMYVRESWKYWGWTEDGMPFIQYRADEAVEFIDGHRIPDEFVGSSDVTWGERLTDIWAELSKDMTGGRASDRRWRPSIHMPRWAARIWLEVTDVRVERVQDITAEDAMREGIDTTGKTYGLGSDHATIKCFREIWDPIYPGTWEDNDWVWVVEFKRVEKEV